LIHKVLEEEDLVPTNAPLLLMKSSGGVTSTLNARRRPVETALSGPAAGAVGAAFIGASAGFRDLLTNDIGASGSAAATAPVVEPARRVVRPTLPSPATLLPPPAATRRP
jgi:N-methylhydantoinase A/oxoprolinase/acetone carboxylase beta subunit